MTTVELPVTVTRKGIPAFVVSSLEDYEKVHTSDKVVTSTPEKKVVTSEERYIPQPKVVTMENLQEVVKELKMDKLAKKLSTKQQLAENLMTGELARPDYPCYVPFCHIRAVERDKFGHWLCPGHKKEADQIY